MDFIGSDVVQGPMFENAAPPACGAVDEFDAGMQRSLAAVAARRGAACPDAGAWSYMDLRPAAADGDALIAWLGRLPGSQAERWLCTQGGWGTRLDGLGTGGLTRRQGMQLLLLFAFAEVARRWQRDRGLWPEVRGRCSASLRPALFDSQGSYRHRGAMEELAAAAELRNVFDGEPAMYFVQLVRMQVAFTRDDLERANRPLLRDLKRSARELSSGGNRSKSFVELSRILRQWSADYGRGDLALKRADVEAQLRRNAWVPEPWNDGTLGERFDPVPALLDAAEREVVEAAAADLPELVAAVRLEVDGGGAGFRLELDGEALVTLAGGADELRLEADLPGGTVAAAEAFANGDGTYDLDVKRVPAAANGAAARLCADGVEVWVGELDLFDEAADATFFASSNGRRLDRPPAAAEGCLAVVADGVDLVPEPDHWARLADGWRACRLGPGTRLGVVSLLSDGRRLWRHGDLGGDVPPWLREVVAGLRDLPDGRFAHRIGEPVTLEVRVPANVELRSATRDSELLRIEPCACGYRVGPISVPAEGRPVARARLELACGEAVERLSVAVPVRTFGCAADDGTGVRPLKDHRPLYVGVADRMRFRLGPDDRDVAGRLDHRRLLVLEGNRIARRMPPTPTEGHANRLVLPGLAGYGGRLRVRRGFNESVDYHDRDRLAIASEVLDTGVLRGFGDDPERDPSHLAAAEVPAAQIDFFTSDADAVADAVDAAVGDAPAGGLGLREVSVKVADDIELDPDRHRVVVWQGDGRWRQCRPRDAGGRRWAFEPFDQDNCGPALVAAVASNATRLGARWQKAWPDLLRAAESTRDSTAIRAAARGLRWAKLPVLGDDGFVKASAFLRRHAALVLPDVIAADCAGPVPHTRCEPNPTGWWSTARSLLRDWRPSRDEAEAVAKNLGGGVDDESCVRAAGRLFDFDPVLGARLARRLFGSPVDRRAGREMLLRLTLDRTGLSPASLAADPLGAVLRLVEANAAAATAHDLIADGKPVATGFLLDSYIRPAVKHLAFGDAAFVSLPYEARHGLALLDDVRPFAELLETRLLLELLRRHEAY